MANLTLCPFCGADIEDDSCFCDQCGNQLHRCPKCGKLRKGKFCPTCGCPTVLPSPDAKPVAPVEPPRQAEPVSPVAPVKPSGPVRLVCKAMGVTLRLVPGAIVGRVNGNYASQLGGFQYLSGTQARLDCNAATGEWTITDLNSRNGTAVSGRQCSPAQPFKIGDVIRFSRSYDFIVE